MLRNPWSPNFETIENPPVPFTHDIPLGLFPNKQLLFTGESPANADRFAINLITAGGQTAFHFNPRFSQNEIIRNSKINEHWGTEEKSPLTFQRQQHFEVVIVAQNDLFHVQINGQHAFDYRHRVPLNEITRINVNGDVRVHHIVFSVFSPQKHLQQAPAVPFTLPLQHVRPGKLIQIVGKTLPHTKRFTVNLQHGDGSQHVLLHLNPRFDDPHEGKAVVRNSKLGGAWGIEERVAERPFPFALDHRFEILILVEPQAYKIAIDHVHYTTYVHRHPLENVDSVTVHGDVFVESIREF